MGRIRHRNLSKSVQGSANKYGTAPTVGRSSFALRLFSFRDVPSKTDARASAAVAILAWVLKKVLLASNGRENDRFGFSVALDGNRALVGAPWRNGLKGAAYIYDLSGGNWTETADISLGTDEREIDLFGWSVALDGDRALVGAYSHDNFKGAAYIFDLSGGNWTETADISLGTDESAGDLFGASVALDGDRALVGAPGRDGGRLNGKGAAYIFDLSGGNWTETADISLGTDASANDNFGRSVALDGDRALVGAYGRDNQGAAYIFDLSGGSWSEPEPKEISLGIDGRENDRFGRSVALDGNRALVGAPGRGGGSGDYYGAAYIFDTTDGNNWTETADISLGTDASANDYFGRSVALDGNRALVGAWGRGPGGGQQGAAYIFDTTDGTTWSEPKEISLGTDASVYDYFGLSVALDGNRALVGAYDRDGPGDKTNQGAAYIFDYERTN